MGGRRPTPATPTVMGERVAAWWSKVLAGQMEQSHPVYGSGLKVSLDGDTLVASGEVASREDLRELERELKGLRRRGVHDYRLETRVAGPSDDARGLLEQTVIGVFDSEEKAKFALELLEEQGEVKPRGIAILDGAEGRRRLPALIPEEYRAEVRSALKGRHVLLIATVDELEAFAVREVLDEETRSIVSLALPPQPRGATS